MMTQQFNDAFKDFDLVVSPTAPVVAFPLGAMSQDPMQLKLLDYCTIPANMGGFPAISLQAGFAHGLPVGIQLMGPQMGDEKLLQTAFAVERVFETQRMRPPIP